MNVNVASCFRLLAGVIQVVLMRLSLPVLIVFSVITACQCGAPARAGMPDSVYGGLEAFGSIAWTVDRLPFVGPGPKAGISGMGMVACRGRIYLLGGFVPGGDDTEEDGNRTSRWVCALAYDILADRWMTIDGAVPCGGVLNDPGVCIIDDTIFVAGAEGPDGSHFNHFLIGKISITGNRKTSP